MKVNSIRKLLAEADALLQQAKRLAAEFPMAAQEIHEATCRLDDAEARLPRIMALGKGEA